MPIELKMPALSPTMEEGTLAKWLVKEGDKVASGDILAEIETDKATMEFEAVDEGTVAKILVPEGSEGVKVGALTAVAAAVALAFLVLPVAAIFLRVPPGTLLHQLSSGVVTDALIVSAKTSLIAQALVLGLGTPLAYLLASRRFRGRAFVITLVELPLVLPPAVAGLGLLAAFGRAGLLGTSIPFTQTAVVLAVAFVSSPLYIRQAIAAFEAVDPDVVAASRTLGAGAPKTFFRVVLPLARGGLAAGAALAFARGLGEFGATIMFAGSLRGVTQTLPLAIYEQFSIDFDTALAMGALLVVVSAALLVFLKLVLSWRLSPQTSGFLFARST